MHTQLILGTGMIVACVIFHVGGLVTLAFGLGHVAPHLGVLNRHGTAITLVAVSVLAVLFMHTAESWGWALLYLYLKEFSSMEEALYYSMVTATTLGYGDITLSDNFRLLGASEAMGGLILFSVSTAFIIQVVRGVFEDEESVPGEGA